MGITSVEQAQKLLQDYQGPAEEFELEIPLTGLTLRGQPIAMSLVMAILTDQVLAKEWWPNGFNDYGGVRYYRYSQ
jgi:hypothetical protein